MARQRNPIANNVTFNMQKTAIYIKDMTNEQLGEWFRKAVVDCCSGCIDPATDCFIKEAYNKSFANMKSRQDIDAKKYKRRLEREGKNLSSGKPNDTISTDNSAEDGEIREDSQDRKSATSSAQTFTDAVTTTPVKAPKAKTRTEGESREGDLTSSQSSSVRKAPGNTIVLAEQKKPYGTCKHVMLTDAEGRHLREVYGENLKIAIDILDAYIENNGKAAKRYKNHAAVLRKGNWVWNKMQETILNDKRIRNAEKTGDRRSFQQKEREDRSNWLNTSLFTTEAANG